MHSASVAACGLPRAAELWGCSPGAAAVASLLWLQSMGSVVEARGLVALQHEESSQTGDQTRVRCIGGQILNHWITRDIPGWVLKGHHKPETLGSILHRLL